MSVENPSKKSTIASERAKLGFEEKLWLAADKLRNNIDAAEYKSVVLGLIFLKYVSDAFEEKYDELKNTGKNPENKTSYAQSKIFWVPKNARWSFLNSKVNDPNIGKFLDTAMQLIETENSKLRGILDHNFNRPSLDQNRLGELVFLIGSIGIGKKENQSKDVLGRVFEYFLSQFASAEGRKGGQFYTPRSIVNLLVNMLEPFNGKIYDPCCGSGGMFVQSEKFIEEHNGNIDDISIFGQESNQTTWKLAKQNLAIRKIIEDVKWNSEGSFLNDAHSDLKSDFILANPPFNVSDWNGELLQEDPRWQFGPPPIGNANYAWIQHIIHHLSGTGMAGFVLSNGSLSSNSGGEDTIRKNIIENDKIDCIITLPGQLFYSTPVSACLWFIAMDKKNDKFRNRSHQTLFIDARKMGLLEDKVHRILLGEEIDRISSTYHLWRTQETFDEYKNVPGFCYSATTDEIRDHRYALVPGRYTGTEAIIEDDEPFNEKIITLLNQYEGEMLSSKYLDTQIKENLKNLLQ